uniref:DUF834 domain-containing protein n=1 Tax=Oryza meridionalis TaxID=40149 RepID=A0A0E0EKJ7_9ORYZ
MTTATRVAGRRQRGGKISPARGEKGAPRAAAEVALAAAKLAVMIARRGDGSSNDGVRPDVAASGGACGERHERGRKHGRARRERKEGEEARGSNL